MAVAEILAIFNVKKKTKKRKKDEIDIFEFSDENDVFIPEEESKEESIMQKASDFIKMFKKRRTS